MLASVLVACSGDPEPPLPRVCNDATPWTPGTPAFRDATKDWGLKELGANGVRINAVDFDGDGWTDLAIRSGNEPDDFAEGTRSAWLLRNTGDGGFEDVTEASGIRDPRGKAGSRGRRGPVWVWADVDNDLDLDVFTGVTYDAASEDVSEIMLNNGDGTFSLGPKSSAIRDAELNPYGAAFTDYDLDGVVDLWIGNYQVNVPTQDRLFNGRGDGGFGEKTTKAGLTTESWSSIDDLNEARAHSLAWSAAACDLNNDGWPELIASSYGRAPNHLWRSEQGSYTNASIASGYAFDHRTDWSDNESARCWCTLNPDDDECAGVPPPEAIACTENSDAFRWSHSSDRNPYRLGGNSGQTVCRDLDNDGWIDLLTTEIVHWDVGTSSDPSEILFNTGSPDVLFERPGNEVTGLTREHDIPDWNDGDITANTVDFDNDGWPDVYIASSDYPGTRGLLYHQVAPRQFEPVPIEDGVDHRRSHGVAVADFDRDGDLDLVLGHSTARCDDECYASNHVRFYENVSPPGNAIQVRLRGDGTQVNGAAIGARVEVTAGGVTQVQQVGGGGGQWGAQDDLVLHFGLGSACEAEVKVVWPDSEQSVSRFSVQGGYRYSIPRTGLLEAESLVQ